MLEETLTELKSTEKFLNFLKFNSSFTQYTLENRMLLWCQNKNVTKVAGFKTWKNLNRNVKKGEKALKIIAPLTYKGK